MIWRGKKEASTRRDVSAFTAASSPSLRISYFPEAHLRILDTKAEEVVEKDNRSRLLAFRWRLRSSDVGLVASKLDHRSFRFAVESARR